MNSKGQINIGGILIAFIGVIVGLLLFQAMNPFIGDATGKNSITVENSTTTLPASGSPVDFDGQELIGSATVTNASGGQIVPTTNYTFAEGVGSDGVKGLIFEGTSGSYVGQSVNLSYSAYPDGYIDNAGGRSIALLIPIFAALLIMVIALVPSLRSGLMDMIK